MWLSGGVSGVDGLKRERHGGETLCRFFLDVRGQGRAACGWMLAPSGLSTPPGVIASPLHCLVLFPKADGGQLHHNSQRHRGLMN